MATTTHGYLNPTNDPVMYDASVVDYPGRNVVDTFGTIWTSKIHAHEMDVLEMASAGKLAFTPDNEHSLDLLLDKSLGNVTLRARNDKSLLLQNETDTASLLVGDDGSVSFSAKSGTQRLAMDSDGARFDVTGYHSFSVGDAEVIRLTEGGAAVSNLVVHGTDFRVPVGEVVDRPVGTEGQVFYNSTANRFEGYVSGSWSGLGGTVDVDQDTYVSAESSAGADDDQLVFVTAGTERLRVGSDGKVGYGTTDPEYDLDWRGGARILAGDDSLFLIDTGGVHLRSASGSNVYGTAAGMPHRFEVGESEMVRIDQNTVSVSNLVVNGSTLRVPAGTEESRPDGEAGLIFYNEDTERFEGFAAGAWGGMGGVVDVDQDTYVLAETSPGTDDDTLVFVTGGQERMRIDDSGRMGYGTSNPEYALDIVGDVRITGNLITSGGATSGGGSIGSGNVLNLSNGEDDIVDGLDTNDGSGLNVEGVPSVGLMSSANRDRFEKSMKWHYNKTGMRDLGTKEGWGTESFWRLRGGDFRLSHVNADSRADVEMIFRINEKDELQLVRHVSSGRGEAETFEVVAKFGNARGEVRYAPVRGDATILPEQTVYDNSMPNPVVDAYIKSVSAYDDYVVYGAVYLASESPTADEVVAAATHADGDRGVVTSLLTASQDNIIQHQFTKMADGGSLADPVLKFCAVVEIPAEADGRRRSAVPITSFIVNDFSIVNEAVAEVSYQAVIDYTVTFADSTWDDMSDADKAIFEAWLTDQIMQSAIEKGIDVYAVDLSFQSGSIIASANMMVSAASLTASLIPLYNSEPLAMLSISAKSKPIEFVDQPPLTVSPASVSKQLQSVRRLQSAPSITSITEAGSTSENITYNFEVAEANSEYAITKIYVLAATSPLPGRVLPSTVKKSPGTQVFDVSGTSGSVTISMASSVQGYAYFVAENNSPVPALSAVYSKISEPFSIMTSSLPVGETGNVRMAAQDGSLNAVQNVSGMTMFSPTDSVTVNLSAYREDDIDIPTTAEEAAARLAAGGVATTITLK